MDTLTNVSSSEATLSDVELVYAKMQLDAPVENKLLLWNESHTVNQAYKYCYCSQDRNLSKADLQCSSCQNFFHVECTNVEKSSTLKFLTNYRFTCRNCANEEVYHLLGPMQWRAPVATALANLQVNKLENMLIITELGSQNQKALANHKMYFSIKEILHFFEGDRWNILCTERQKLPTFSNTLCNTLFMNRQIFEPKTEEKDHRNLDAEFSLLNTDLFLFRPGYVSPLPKDPRKRTGDEHDSARKVNKLSIFENEYLPDELKFFLARRKPPQSSDYEYKPKFPVFSQEQEVNTEFFSIDDHPFNKPNFRYLSCIADKNFPTSIYRHSNMLPDYSRIDWSDISTHILVTKDGLAATTKAGFRMARSNICLRSGSFYFEVNIVKGGGDENAHVRVGISRREASLDAPVGFDAYSYGIRDKNGEKVHRSRPKEFMSQDVCSGDILGFHVFLPEPSSQSQLNRCVRKEIIPIRYKGQMYFECSEYQATKEMINLSSPAVQKNVQKSFEPEPINGSFLQVYKNGVCMGTAFENLASFWPPNSKFSSDQITRDDGYSGYFPAISCYKGGIARFNFGPNFSNDMPLNAKPACTRYIEQLVDDLLWDIYNEVLLEKQCEKHGYSIADTVGNVDDSLKTEETSLL